MAARAEIDAGLNTLQNFMFDAEESPAEQEIETFTNLICAFHLGQKTRARFARLEQVHVFYGQIYLK